MAVHDLVVVGRGQCGAVRGAGRARGGGARAGAREGARARARAATRSSPRAASASPTRASRTCGATSCPTSRRWEARSIERAPPTPRTSIYDDIMRVTEGLSDIDLTSHLVQRSRPTVVWMRQQGIRWILMFGRQSYKVGDRHHFCGGLTVEAVGGGAGLVEIALRARRARRASRCTTARARASSCTDETGGVRAVVVAHGPDGVREIPCPRRRPRLAAASRPIRRWRTRYLGPDWDLAHVRGTRFNTGDGIRMALDIGAQSYGHWSSLPRRGVGPALAALSATAASATCTRSTRTRIGHHRQPRRRALRGRGRRLPQLHLRQVRPRDPAPAAAPGLPDLRPEDGRRSFARSTASARSPRRKRQHHRGAGATSSRSIPQGLARTVRRLQRGGPGRAVQPVDPRRQGHARASRRPRPTGRCRSTRRPT